LKKLSFDFIVSHQGFNSGLMEAVTKAGLLAIFGMAMVSIPGLLARQAYCLDY